MPIRREEPDWLQQTRNPTGGKLRPPEEDNATRGLDLEAIERDLLAALDPTLAPGQISSERQPIEFSKDGVGIAVTNGHKYDPTCITIEQLEQQAEEYARRHGAPLPLNPCQPSPKSKVGLWRPPILEDPDPDEVEKKRTRSGKSIPKGKRDISFCTGKDMPHELTTRIVKRWNEELSVNSIMKDTNYRLQGIGRVVEEIDIFAIVMTAKSMESSGQVIPKDREKVKDRNVPNELSLESFRSFISKWKEGCSFDLCCRAVNGETSSKYFLQKIFSQLSERWRRVRREEELNRNRRLKMAVFDEAMLMASFRVSIDETPYLLIPIDKLPKELDPSLEYIPVRDLGAQPKKAEVPKEDSTEAPKKMQSLPTSDQITLEEGYEEKQRRLQEQLEALNQQSEADSLNKTVPMPESPEDPPPSILEPVPPEVAEAETPPDFEDMSLEELLGMGD